METATRTIRDEVICIRKFAITVVSGPDEGLRVESSREDLTIGTDPANDLALSDASVSRHHCVLQVTDKGLELRDLGSRNGTFVGNCEISGAIIPPKTLVHIGRCSIQVDVLGEDIIEELSEHRAFGDLLGESVAMRRLFAILERFAASDATVLLNGETGTGKELAAEAIHRASPRRQGSFIVVDCGALPKHLIESELFGHARGAFTGAASDREGAFELADGGTVFLDEIGELAVDLQPSLLRVLENRTVRRIGETERRTVDVRVIAATHRDLRVDVNRKRFRADLFFRLNVLRLEMPPLRDRGQDIAMLASKLWRQFRPNSDPPVGFVTGLLGQHWPGNVRELRNTVERAALLGWGSAPAPAKAAPESFGQAKELAIASWERAFLVGLLTKHDWNVSSASRAAKMSRSHLRLLIGRHGIERE